MNGIICIDKPEGITSFGAVSRVKGIMHIKKLGHTGTLDPMATGVLPVMLGKATRFLDYFPDSDKGYRAGLLLGRTTDTLDVTGKTLSESEVNVTEEELKSVLEEFKGKILQLPPMYSAKNVDGKRLYELARQGVEAERKPCEVEIKGLSLLGGKDGGYVIDVLCSKGTYIRSLIDDIGKRLGCGAVMSALRRTRATGFTLEGCVTLEELQQRGECGESFDDLIISLDEIFKEYISVCVSEAQAKRFLNGGELDIDRVKNPPEKNTICTVYSPDGVFLGLAENDGTQLKIIRILPR